MLLSHHALTGRQGPLQGLWEHCWVSLLMVLTTLLFCCGYFRDWWKHLKLPLSLLTLSPYMWCQLWPECLFILHFSLLNLSKVFCLIYSIRQGRDIHSLIYKLCVCVQQTGYYQDPDRISAINKKGYMKRYVDASIQRDSKDFSPFSCSWTITVLIINFQSFSIMEAFYFCLA